MALGETAKLLASLDLKDGLTPVVKTMTGSLDKLDRKFGTTSGRASKAGQQIGTGIKAGVAIAAVGVGALITQIAAGLGQLAELEDLTTATNTVIKSTGGVAGQTASDIRSLAEQMEGLNATMDDKVIQSGENLLLTFTNIRKDAFEPALLAILDMNEAMGGGPEGLQKTVIQVGKALNDPIKGYTALKRVGVAFTAAQIKQIKTLQESGDLLGAQKIILRELGVEFGGRFAAAGTTAKATVAGIGDAVEDLQKALATGLFPVIQKWLPKLRDFLASPAFIKGANDLGDAIAGMFSDENIRTGVGILQDFFKTAKDVAPAIQAGLQGAGEVVKVAVDAFRSLPPEIQGLAVAGLAVNKLTGGLVTNLAGGLISAVISSFKGLMNVNAAVVNVNGPVVGGKGGGLPDILPKVATGAATAGAAGLGVISAGLIAGTVAPLVATKVLTELTDPKGLNPLRGAAATATARGVPDWNNKALIELKRIGEDRPVQEGFSKLLSATERAKVAAAASARATAAAIKAQDLTANVDLHVNVPVQTVINGRVLEANITRYHSYVSGQGITRTAGFLA